MGDNDTSRVFSWNQRTSEGRNVAFQTYTQNIHRTIKYCEQRPVGAALSARLHARPAARRKRLMDQTACKPGSVPTSVAGSAAIIPLDRPLLDGSRDLPGRLGRRALPPCGGAASLFGLAPSGACHAVPVARSAVGSYPTLSPLPHAEARGGLLSVALSLGSPPAGVTRRLFAVEPGLSSASPRGETATARPSDPARR